MNKKPVHLAKDLLKSFLLRFQYRLIPQRVIQQYVEAATDPYLRLYHEADETANPPHDRAGDDFSKERRFFTLWQAAGQVLTRNIPGDFAECGCKHGHSSYIMARRLAECSEPHDRLMWIFDSFEGGLSDKQEQDRSTRLADTNAAKTKQQKERFASSFEHVQHVFRHMPFVHLVKGWIPQSLNGDPAGRRYSLVHIDVDLYEPTKGALEFFYPRLSEGGLMVIDDYGSATFPGCQKAVDDFLAQHPHKFFLISHTLGCVIMK
ncbi:MAG: class I SAM-dependent methyltransferase [Rhodospirillales bacterium]|nr:class I SAM-dependent methyltransferase [Rhodospirillales bacterium]